MMMKCFEWEISKESKPIGFEVVISIGFEMVISIGFEVVIFQ